MWQHESGVIDMLCPAPEGIVLPLIHVKGVLRTVIDDSKLSKKLLISSEQAERVPYIIDQILAHSHAAAAASLSRGSQRFATARDLLNTRLPGSYNPGTSAHEIYTQNSEGKVMLEGTSQKKHCLNRLWTMQSLSKDTPWGTMKAEIYLVGDCLYSETLYFRLRFSPNPQLSNTGLVIDYTSHHILSLVHLDHQLAQPDRQPWNTSEVIKSAPLFHLILTAFKVFDSLVQSWEEFMSKYQGFLQQTSHHSKALGRLGCQHDISQMDQHLSEIRKSMDEIPCVFNKNSPACEDDLAFLPDQQQRVRNTREFTEVNHRPVELLGRKLSIQFDEFSVLFRGLIAKYKLEVAKAFQTQALSTVDGTRNCI